MNPVLEICAGDVGSVRAAAAGGAARVELCSALSEGGITPSAALIEYAVSMDKLRTHVLIRPRTGDFLYDADEVAVMERDIAMAVELGAHGVVIGALTPGGDVDMAVCRRLVSAARGRSVTFHRAFDRCRDASSALEDIISLGCDRVLTSGQAPVALEGAETLRRLVDQAAGRICIMPGSGVSPHNAAEILRKSGATEIHASARRPVSSRMIYKNDKVYMGAADADENEILVTSADVVADIINAINNL